jgi:hypothetical protein
VPSLGIERRRRLYNHIVGRSVGRSVGGSILLSSIMGSYSPTHALQHQQKNKTQTINCSACNKKIDNQQYIVKFITGGWSEEGRLHSDTGVRVFWACIRSHTTLDTTHCYPLSREDDDSHTSIIVVPTIPTHLFSRYTQRGVRDFAFIYIYRTIFIHYSSLDDDDDNTLLCDTTTYCY